VNIAQYLGERAMHFTIANRMRAELIPVEVTHLPTVGTPHASTA